MFAVPPISILKRQLLQSAGGSIAIRILSLLVTIAASVVLARALGPTAYGTYAYIFAIVTLLALPTQVGIPTLLVRETAKAQAEADWPKLKGLWFWSTRTIFVTSTLVALLSTMVVFLRGWSSRDGVELTMLAGIVLIPLIALGNARGAALRGLRLIVRGQLPETVIRPILLVIFVGSFWFLDGAVSAYSAMTLHVFAAGVSFVIGGVLLWFAKPKEVFSIRADMSHAPYWWRAAIPLAVLGGIQVIVNQSGLVLLGWFRPETEVGLYKVAMSASLLAIFGLQTAGLVVGPYMARFHSLGDIRQLRRMASLAAIMSSALTFPILLVFFLKGRWLIDTLYGADYVNAFVPLLILASGQMIHALFGSVGLILNMTGHERDAVRWLAVSACCNIILSLLLIPVFGMQGAAIAAVASLLIWNFAFWRIAILKLNVDGSVVSVFRGVWR